MREREREREEREREREREKRERREKERKRERGTKGIISDAAICDTGRGSELTHVRDATA